MSTKIILCALLFVSFYMGSNSLKCNWCIGSLTSDCAKNDTDSTAQETCRQPRPRYVFKPTGITGYPDSGPRPPPRPTFDLKCTRLVLRGDQYTSDVVIRGCGYIFHNQDLCTFLKKRKTNVKYCKACDDDLCN